MAVLLFPVALAVSALPTYGGVGAAGGVVHERKVTSSSVGGTGVVKDQRIGSNGGVLCAGGVEQERYRASCSIGITVVTGQCPSADTGIETAGGIRKRATANRVLYFQRQW